MDFSSCILLHSKYSNTSNSLIKYIKTCGINFDEIVKLQYVCVDNEEIRNRILKNTQIQIETVPCILLIYNDGGVEKYEGSDVFEWCKEVVKEFLPKSQPTKLSGSIQQQSSKSPIVMNIDPEPIKPLKPKPKKQHKNPSNIEKETMNITNLEELMSEDETIAQIPSNTLQSHNSDSKKQPQKNTDLMAKAKELEKGRTETIPPPPGHPSNKPASI